MYEHSQEVVFGKRVMVIQRYFSAFRVMDDDLRDAGITSNEYAYTTTIALHKWALTKGYHHIPIRVFLGPWALKKFMKVYESKSVEMYKPELIDKAALIYSEEIVATRYLHVNIGEAVYTKFKDVVEDMRPLLDAKWLEMWDNKINRDEIRADVLERMCKFHHKKLVKSYQELLKLL
jgi:hypothetical protein